MSEITVRAFYKFVAIEDTVAFRDAALDMCDTLDMRGSILVAPEGINGTVAGTRESADQLFDWLQSDQRFADLPIRESVTDALPFNRMKVRLKKEIVTFRQDVDPTAHVGTYVEPQDWNEVISDPDVLVIDTRNKEEVQIGSFENAVDPGTDSFTQFADFVSTLDPGDHPKVAMFCTGGIRCEKASSYMLQQGFGEVFHLKGGILRYLEDVSADESMWQGDCFVFDERVTVDHSLQQGDYTLCRGCRKALSQDDRSTPEYEEGVSCSECIDSTTPERTERLRERQRQMQIALETGKPHLAPNG